LAKIADNNNNNYYYLLLLLPISSQSPHTARHGRKFALKLQSGFEMTCLLHLQLWI